MLTPQRDCNERNQATTRRIRRSSSLRCSKCLRRGLRRLFAGAAFLRAEGIGCGIAAPWFTADQEALAPPGEVAATALAWLAALPQAMSREPSSTVVIHEHDAYIERCQGSVI